MAELNKIYRSKIVLLLLALWLWNFFQSDLSAEIHGKVFPVVSVLTVETVNKIERDGVVASHITGTAVKNYSCDYKSMTWHLTSDFGKVPITSYFLDKPEVRGAGIQYWGALIVGVDPKDLDQAEAVVKHKCGWFPVISKFYGG